jgi:hypothetical protein
MNEAEEAKNVMGKADQERSAFEEEEEEEKEPVNSHRFSIRIKIQVIDGCFRIVKRFNDSIDTIKMVFECKDLNTGEYVVVKVFTKDEQP